MSKNSGNIFVTLIAACFFFLMGGYMITSIVTKKWNPKKWKNASGNCPSSPTCPKCPTCPSGSGSSGSNTAKTKEECTALCASTPGCIGQNFQLSTINGVQHGQCNLVMD